MRTIYAMVLLGLACLSARAAEGIAEFELATKDHRPQAICVGPDGNLWVTEVIKHNILKVTPDGKITEFAVPKDKVDVGVLQGIAAGSDGKIWFTSREENSVRRLKVDGTFDGSFLIPSQNTSPGNQLTKGCWPREICPGPDGKLYFAEMAANKIGCIDVEGKITEYPIATADAQPYCVTVGPDKNIWFTLWNVDKLGKLDLKTGTITEYPVGAPKCKPRELCAGPDGNLWFSENSGNKVGKMTPEGKVTEFAVATADSQPLGITAASDGNVWVCLFKAGKVARVTMDGKITEFALPTPNSQPFCLCAGPDGTVWVAEQANRIARIKLSEIDKQSGAATTEKTAPAAERR